MTRPMRRDDLRSVIMSDHQSIDDVFVELECKHHRAGHRRALVDHVITELVRHTVAEERCLYPEVRQVLEGGGELADYEITGHAEAEKVMNELAGRSTEDPEFEPLLSKLIRDVRQHVQHEEGDLLPRVARGCSTERLRELGRKALRLEKTTPTRPHPRAPSRPTAAVVPDAGPGLIERVRGALAGCGAPS